MNSLKKYLSVMLALMLMLSVFSACGRKSVPAATESASAETAAATEAAVVTEAETPVQQTVSDGFYHMGDKIDDFTVTTFDGREVTLYNLLEEKDMVLLNLFATWCGPCGAEMPALQEAYTQYQDKIEIIALSTFEGDTDDVLAEYVQEKGMTFPVTRDTVGLAERIHAGGIPTSIVIDRFGTICMIHVGSSTDPAVFTDLFDIYTPEDYAESVFMPNLHAKLPDVKTADTEALNAALNEEGGNLVFTNASDRFHWPMIVEEKDGRMVASASNVDSPKSNAVLETQVEAKAGDVLVMEYQLSSDYNLSILHMSVDGQDVKITSLCQGWTTASYAFEESGTHQISVRFERVFNENEGKEGLWIDTIRLVTGEEAAEILANKPHYPVGEEVRMDLLNENVGVCAFVLEGTNDVIGYKLLCSDPVLRIAIELDETMDPETAYLMDFADNVYPLTSFVHGDGYLVEIPNEDPSAYSSSSVWVYCNGAQIAYANIYASLEDADRAAIDLGNDFDLPLRAVLWDDSMTEEEETQSDAAYTVTYVDQNGDPVPGVMCQVCDAATCQVFVSDDNGVCQFTLSAGYYEIHTLMVPEGYEGDTTTITEAPLGGGELSFTLTKK